MILLGLVIALGVRFYSDKDVQIDNLKLSLEESKKELGRVENEVKEVSSKNASLLKEKEGFTAELEGVKKEVLKMGKLKTSIDKKTSLLKEENDLLRNSLDDINDFAKKKIEIEKNRFDKKLKLARRHHKARLEKITGTIELLKTQLDSFDEKESTLGKIIKEATADVGRERMKFHHFQLALSYEYNERYKDAIEEYEKVLRLDPNNTETYLQIASIYTYKLDDIDKAEFYVKKYAELKHMESLMLGSEGDIQQDDTDLPIQFLKEELADLSLRNITLESRMLDMKSSFKKNQRLVNEMRDVVKKKDIIEDQLGLVAEKLKEEKLRFHYNLAFMYDRGMDYKNACKEYLEVLKIDPDDADTHYNLAIVYDDQLKNKKEAVKHYQRYLELRPASDDAHKVEYWLARAIKADKSNSNVFGVKANVLRPKKKDTIEE